MKKLKNKKFLIPTIMTIILIIIGSVAYAYLQSQVGPGATARITVDPKTVDELKFSNCGDINIKLTQFNFTDGGSNLSDSTCAKAILRANNSTNSATETYNVYLSINSNGFAYSTAPTNTPEVLLKVTNPNGTVVNSITGLTYATSGGVSGFDITTKTGLIKIAENYSITTTSTKTDTWNIEVYFINLANNQAINAGKSLNASIITRKTTISNSDYSEYLVNQHFNRLQTVANGHEGVYFVDANGNLDYGDNTKIYTSLGGDIPQGVASYWNNTLIYACLKYNNSNYEYSLKTDTISTRALPCLTDRAQNFVINGDLSSSNNSNLSTIGTYNSGGYLTKTVSARTNANSDDYIPIDPNKRYQVSLSIKSNKTAANYYVGFREYDEYYNEIAPDNVMYVANTLTTLAQDLNTGATTVYLTDLTNWLNSGSQAYQRGFIFWNYTDNTGYAYPESTYSRNVYYNTTTPLYAESGVSKTNNTITLTSAWTGPNIPAGTKVSESNKGSIFNYSAISNKTYTSSWTTVNGSIVTGVNNAASVNYTKFRAGTRFVRFAVTLDYNSTASTTTDIKDISIREV